MYIDTRVENFKIMYDIYYLVTFTFWFYIFLSFKTI